MPWTIDLSTEADQWWNDPPHADMAVAIWRYLSGLDDEEAISAADCRLRDLPIRKPCVVVVNVRSGKVVGLSLYRRGPRAIHVMSIDVLPD
ncbi:MAG: hypothetical protein IT440_09805 [Phycisphaeraceae bacterium]|nr:hypothetical protein [Phycisphaeraceae bacterium]